jgi:hypothetical protein
MKEPKDFYNDPQLTAYALGELEGDECAAVEATLKTDAAARAAVDEIRATARQLEAALASEPMPEFKAMTALSAHQAAIVRGRDPWKLDGGPLHNLIRFPRAYYLIGGLAAACFAVMLTLHESEVVHLAGQEKAADVQAARERQSLSVDAALKKSAQVAAEAKAPSYDEVTFPAPSIPTGRVELQAKAQEMAEADKKNAFAGSIAANQPADVETVKKPPSFDVSAAPASGYSASETMTDSSMSGGIAGVNNSVAYDFPPRATPDGFKAEADHADDKFLSVAQNPLSTFGLDVDTASYANVRRFLQAGERPPADAVRIEELVNYFPYAYAAPRDHAPLAATLEVAAAPWAPTHRLVRIGLKAREVTAGGTPVPVAKDVKVQVKFNPAQVQSYRLIGYDDRALKKGGFNNDAVTAGDVDAGHTVTALYEIVPAGAASPGVDALKYQKVGGEGRSSFAEATEDREARGQGSEAGNLKSEISNPEILTVTVRYTLPGGGASQRLEFPLTDRGAAFAEASMDFKFAAAVAGFGMILRESPLKGNATLAGVEQWAGQGLGPDTGGYRAEFIGLVHQAEKLKE